jgi:predicted SnoaL-like aldol condensation-catalyzing enzyme
LAAVDHTTRSEVDQTTRNEEAVRRCIEEVMNKRNVALVDELFAPNYVEHPLWHQPHLPKIMEGKSLVEGMKAYLAKDDPNYENLHTTIDQMISVGDKVVTVYTDTATRNGKQISWTAMEIARFEDGRFVESWALFDRIGLYQQLGVVPSTPELMKQAGLEA